MELPKEKPEGYYTQARSELLPLLEPLSDAVVLDVGCGAGALGSLLKGNGARSVIGIEYDSKAAAEATVHYDKVFACAFEQVDFHSLRGFFDIVVCADILEHLPDPWSALKTLHGTLKPNGILVASIPNLRHRRVIANLLAGKFDYQPSGILDKTHLRFFTFDSVLKLFVESGFKVETLGPVYSMDADAMLPKWEALGLSRKLKEMVKILADLDVEFNREDLLDLFTSQFILKARKIS